MACKHFLRSALEYHLATFAASTRAYVDYVVGSKHHVLVVLHDDDRVAKVAQLAQRAYQSLVVALMKSYRRLVENVEHVNQLRAYLCCQTYALALAARQTGRLTVERQVVEPYV